MWEEQYKAWIPGDKDQCRPCWRMAAIPWKMHVRTHLTPTHSQEKWSTEVLRKIQWCPSFKPILPSYQKYQTPLSFHASSYPSKKRTKASWNAQRWDSQGKKKRGEKPPSCLSSHWNIYYHLLEKCHQDKRLLVINKSKQSDNWNPVKFSSNIKTKGAIC